MERFQTAARAWLLMLVLAPGFALAGDDAAVLTAMLHEFLANADQRAAHERFWAQDLVYSSSDGRRFGKADIMQRFDNAEPGDGSPPTTVYSGEDVDIRQYDDVAIVAFRLVGTPADGSETLYYYNTGTFLKRDGEWRVIAWHATRIPPTPGD